MYKIQWNPKELGNLSNENDIQIDSEEYKEWVLSLTKFERAIDGGLIHDTKDSEICSKINRAICMLITSETSQAVSFFRKNMIGRMVRTQNWRQRSPFHLHKDYFSVCYHLSLILVFKLFRILIQEKPGGVYPSVSYLFNLAFLQDSKFILFVSEQFFIVYIPSF